MIKKKDSNSSIVHRDKAFIFGIFKWFSSNPFLEVLDALLLDS